MLEDSKVVDAPPHKISIEQTVAMAKDFELLVLFTSTPGFHVDVKIAEMMKDSNPKLKVAFVGPPVTVEPEKMPARHSAHRLRGPARVRPSDRRLTPRARRWRRLPGRQLPRERRDRPQSGRRRSSRTWTQLPWVTKIYKRDLDFRALQRPVPAESVHLASTPRAAVRRMCTFCLWPQTHSGHRWRLRSADDVANEVALGDGELPRPQRDLLRRRHVQLPARRARSSCARS